MLALTLCTLLVSAGGDDWPQFRGPSANGLAESMPGEFDEPTWKVAVPGLAHASPVVSGGKVFVATAVPIGIEPELKVGLYGAGDSADDLVDTEFRVLAFDAKTGELLWNTQGAKAVPAFGRHTKATQLNSTPAVEGDAVVAILGTAGLFCFDAEDGKLRWKKDLGPLDCGPWNVSDLHWGYASSPIVHDGSVVVQVDVVGDSYLARYDLKTGDEIWRTKRDDVDTWCTPTILPASGDRKTQVLVNGCKEIGAYGFDDGKIVWTAKGGGGIPVPTPVIVGERLLFTSNHRPIDPSHPQSPIFCLRTNATGDLGVPDAEHEAVDWVVSKLGTYMQTPISTGGLVWFCKDNGIVACLDLATGETKYRERLPGSRTGYSASGVGTKDGLLFVNEAGEFSVIAAKGEYEVLAEGSLGEDCMSTPALSGGAVFFRSKSHLWRFD